MHGPADSNCLNSRSSCSPSIMTRTRCSRRCEREPAATCSSGQAGEFLKPLVKRAGAGGPCPARSLARSWRVPGTSALAPRTRSSARAEIWTISVALPTGYRRALDQRFQPSRTPPAYLREAARAVRTDVCSSTAAPGTRPTADAAALKPQIRGQLPQPEECSATISRPPLSGYLAAWPHILASLGLVVFRLRCTRAASNRWWIASIR